MPAAAAPPLPIARGVLLGIAYRMVGSLADAEDVLQEAHLRWAARDPAEALASPRAWLERVVVNLCLDHLKSARVRRETYVGPWLPEPVPTDPEPFDGSTDREAVSLAVLALLERLSPLERAVYVLAEAFDYGHDEVAAVLGREPAAVRQLLHRARAHVAEGRPRFAPSAEAHAAMLAAFVSAVQSGDLKAVEGLLAAGAVARTDGGGKARAALNEIHGADRVARFVVGIAAKGSTEAAVSIEDVNGWPSVVVREGGRVTTVLAIVTDGQAVSEVLAVVNPDKLRAFGRPGDVTGVARTSSTGA